MIGSLTINEYEVEGYGSPELPVRIVRHTSPFYEGTKWAVKWLSNVLGKDGMWAHEPQPSSRDEEFYAMYRFDTVGDASVALANSTDKMGPKRRE